MKSSVIKQPGSLVWPCGLLVAVALLLCVAAAAGAEKKQAVQAKATYLAAPAGGETSVTPSGNIHRRGTIVSPIMMISGNPLINGRLAWVGDFNMDSQSNGVGAGTGTIVVGTWDFSSGVPVFVPSPTGGLWVTKFEVKGNMSLAYDGRVVAHGLDGEVEGMVAVLDFSGGKGVEDYTGWILEPLAEK